MGNSNSKQSSKIREKNTSSISAASTQDLSIICNDDKELIKQRSDKLECFCLWFSVGNLNQMNKLIRQLQFLQNQQNNALNKKTLDIMINCLKTSIKYNQGTIKKLNQTNDSFQCLGGLKKWQQIASIDEIIKYIKSKLPLVGQKLKQIKLNDQISKSSKNHSKQIAAQYVDNELLGLITPFWIGMVIINYGIWNNSTTKQKNYNFALQDLNIISPQIYDIVSQYIQMIQILPALTKISRIINDNLGIQYLQKCFSQQQIQCNNGNYGMQIKTFKKDLIKLIKKVLDIRNKWKQVQQQLMNNRNMAIKISQQKKLIILVQEMNSLTQIKSNINQEKQQLNNKQLINQNDSNLIKKKKTVQELQQQNTKLFNQNKSLKQKNDLLLKQIQKYQEKPVPSIIQHPGSIKQDNIQIREFKQRIRKDKQQEISKLQIKIRQYQQFQKNNNIKLRELQKCILKDKCQIMSILNERSTGSTIQSQRRSYNEQVDKTSNGYVDKQQLVLQQDRKIQISSIIELIQKVNIKYKQQIKAHFILDQQNNNYYQNQIKSLKNQITSLNNQIIQLKNKIKQLQNNVIQQKGKITQLQNKITQLQNKIIQFQDKIKQLNNQIQQLNKANHILTSQLIIKQQLIQSLKQSLQSLKKQKQSIQHQNKLLNNKLQLANQQFKSQLQKIQNKHHNQYNLLKDQNKQLITLINSSKLQIQQLQQQIKKIKPQHQIYVNNLQQQIRNLQKQCHKYSSQYTQKSQEVQKMVEIIKKTGRCYTQYFNGHIININKNQHTQWFVDTIEKYMGKQIKLTYPLYRFDLSNQNSFHNYIDFKPNIVMVCKMTNGQIIAGFSQPGFKPQTNVDYKEGLMFGFKNRKVFNVKAKPSSKANKTNPKPITYDEYFIIWGNSDIRIKSGTKQLYSNYSTGNCSYEDKGNPNPSVNDLFLQPERDAVVEDFEFYQIEFDDERFA